MTYANVDVILLDDEPFYVTRAAVPAFFFGEAPPFGAGSSAARPVVTIISPPEGGPIGPTEPFIFTVTCTETIALQRFNLRTGGAGSAWEVQYRDGEVSPGSEVTRTAITDGYRFEVRRASRWVGRAVELEPFFGTAAALAAVNT